MLNILVVDDEMRVAETICDMLREFGHKSIATRNAIAALGAVEMGEFDLAIVDVNLGPGIDGVSLARLFHDQYDVESVFISGYVTPGLESLVREVGLDFLPKPFTRDQLIAAVGRSELELDRKHA